MQRELSGRRTFGCDSRHALPGVWGGIRRIGRARKLRPTRTRSEAVRCVQAHADPRPRDTMAEVRADDVRVAANTRGPFHHRPIGGLGDPFIESARDHRGLGASFLAACAMLRACAGGRS
jgi:hypothetical protein